MFGYTPAELIGKSVELIFPDCSSDTEEVSGLCHFKDLAVNADPVQVGGRRKDGAHLTLEATLNRMETANGEFLLASLINVTDRVASEAKLRETETRMLMAAEVAHLGMWTWDPPEPHVWTSLHWKWIHGYSPEEQIGFESLLERVHPEDRERVGRTITEACSQQRSFLLQHRVILPDGKVRWISNSGRVEQKGKNGGVRVLGFSIDITDQRETQEAAFEVSGKLITAQEDERRRIARDLHDDLNQRLALLSVEADLLGQIENNPKAEPIVADIVTQVKDLSTEIHQLSYRLHPAKLEQLGLVAATQSLCNEQRKQLNLGVEFTHSNVPRELSREAALCIYRIVQEALRNVGRHSGATQVNVNVSGQGSELSLVVSDNGCGFETSRVAHHAGLGLIGMRERVRLVQGTLVVDSAPGKGTRIEVRVPVANRGV
jgi:PAS domain S-box-containing protein